MRRLAPALALLTLAVVAAPAAAQQPVDEHGGAVHRTRISFDAFTPARLQILTGETVTWTNGSARAHTVTADDGSFGSGRLAMSERFSHEFGAIGEVPYHCALHPFMRGVVAATDLLLDAPSQAASPKRPFPLSGRSAMSPGTPVSIEADHGAGFTPIAATTVGPEGTFVARLQPTATATYRAVAGAATTRPVVLLVLDRRIVLRVQCARTRAAARYGEAALAGRPHRAAAVHARTLRLVARPADTTGPRLERSLHRPHAAATACPRRPDAARRCDQAGCQPNCARRPAPLIAALEPPAPWDHCCGRPGSRRRAAAQGTGGACRSRLAAGALLLRAGIAAA